MKAGVAIYAFSIDVRPDFEQLSHSFDLFILHGEEKWRSALLVFEIKFIGEMKQ